ncbi:hypothetical protein BDY21DRAFT_6755 [Lineolata rhizophorae]|uniref:Uncharacterized protein n=1 Tax=Lineolata rhizophorae TaxID=578093 RepID=A0A6A6PE16_9PEZI|nr:hypothetical protein BDY21DRAFT_6755 [Lineolata rhizophorae]
MGFLICVIEQLVSRTLPFFLSLPLFCFYPFHTDAAFLRPDSWFLKGREKTERSDKNNLLWYWLQHYIDQRAKYALCRAKAFTHYPGCAWKRVRFIAL